MLLVPCNLKVFVKLNKKNPIFFLLSTYFGTFSYSFYSFDISTNNAILRSITPV